MIFWADFTKWPPSWSSSSLEAKNKQYIPSEAKIKTEAGESYLIKSGDLVEFPEGLSCEWQIIKSLKKHFRLGE